MPNTPTKPTPLHFTQLIDGTLVYTSDQMLAYAYAYAYADALAAERVREEREACLAEIEEGIWFDMTTEQILDNITAAIRARKG